MTVKTIELVVKYAGEGNMICPLPSRELSFQSTSLTARERHVMDCPGEKIAIITGAGSGIGQVAATLLVERDAAVIIADINGRTATASAPHERGLSSVATITDLGDEVQIAEMIQKSVREYGGLDILYNDAALRATDVVDRDMAINDIGVKPLARVLLVDVSGSLHSAKDANPQMPARCRGGMINTSAGTARLGERIRPMYSTSKAAIIGMTRNIVTQNGKQGFHSIAIARGFIVTPAVAATIPPEVRRLSDALHAATARRPPRIRCQSRRLSCVR
jgi:NAD(P)-dependent dehydrogenase (short-subunit alcohol dehydrogenase family)